MPENSWRTQELTFGKEILTKTVVKKICLKIHGGLRNQSFSKEFLTKRVVKKIQLKNHGGLRNWDFW